MMRKREEIVVVECVSLSGEEILAIVQRSVDERIPIDSLITKALYPQGSPTLWGSWSPEAREVWQDAIGLYDHANRKGGPTDIGPAPRPKRIFDTSMPPVEAVWDAVEESAGEDHEARLNYVDLAKRLNLRSRRRCQYVIDQKMGFRIELYSVRVDGKLVRTRKLVEGPCQGCGLLHELGEVISRFCPACKPGLQKVS
jgi:hypothetical protein